jgi:hypothetical protein
MLTTVPDDPPAAGPERALDPPPPDPRPPAEPLAAAAAEGDVAIADGVPQAAETPITAHISTAPMIHPRRLLDSRGRTSTKSADVVFETGRMGAFSMWLIGSGPFMGMRKEWRPFISG